MKLSDIINTIKGLFTSKGTTQKEWWGDPSKNPFVTHTPTPTATPTPTPVPDPYEARTMETFDKQGIPRPIAYGIKQAEGGVNNSYNIGATDSNPNGGIDYGSPEAEATAAAKLLNGTFEKGKIGSGVFNQTFKPAYEIFKKTGDIRKFLKDIANAGYAGDVNTWKQRSASAGGAGLNYDRWDDFVADTVPYKKWNGKY